jgi:uncharacterized DUF497 family protein
VRGSARAERVVTRARPQFDWDSEKARTNFLKHGVTFDDATAVWDDPLHLIRFDRIEAGEERRHTLGMVAGVVLLLVVHTYIGEADDKIRIIGARKATRPERRAYEDGDL